MAAAIFGFARPIPFGKLKKGMLVLAAPVDGQRFLGVVTKIREDFILIVLSATDGDVLGNLDLGYCVDDLWLVPGLLEMEPIGPAFEAGSRRAIVPGYVLDSDGNAGVIFHHTEFGQTKQFLVNLDTGEHFDRAEKIGYFKDARFFIRQEGRKERFPMPDLTAER